MPPGPKEVHATLRSLGEHASIWVDDEAWDKTVKASDVALLEERFNRAAPSGSVDPTRGVFDIDRAYFGDLPDQIDKDPRATVLITPFAQFHGTSLDGYFNAFDQMPDKESWAQYQQHSNEKNIIYLNAAGSPVASDYMQGVLAHEFSHLLQFGRNPDQAGWLGETMAEVAMGINGYHTDYGHVARHQKKPESPVESDTYVDYGASYLLGTYMLERYGAGFITEVARQPGSGREAIERVLRGTGDNFEGLIADWTVANYADARGVIAPGHHYASLDVPAPAETVIAASGDRTEGTLKPTGAAYVRIETPARVTTDGEGAAAIRVMRFDGAHLQVDTLAKDMCVSPGSVLAVASVGTAPVHYAVTAS